MPFVENSLCARSSKVPPHLSPNAINADLRRSNPNEANSYKYDNIIHPVQYCNDFKSSNRRKKRLPIIGSIFQVWAAFSAKFPQTTVFIFLFIDTPYSLDTYGIRYTNVLMQKCVEKFISGIKLIHDFYGKIA